MQRAIVIMSRIPVPGKTKTRLMAIMSGEECAAFHRACLTDIFRVVRDTGLPVYLYYTGGEPEGLLADCFPGLPAVSGITRGFMKWRPQQGEDLGQRLAHAAQEVLASHGGVIFLGADMPELSPRLILSACKSLDKRDVVIGPAQDGGYYLLGINRFLPALFAGIPWGTGRVLEETLARCRQEMLTVALLETKGDLDTWEDLVLFYKRGLNRGHQGLNGLASYRFAREMVTKYGIPFL